MLVHRREFVGTCFASVAFGQQNQKQVEILDTHTHFYDPTRPQGVPWPGKQDSSLYRKVLPEDYKKIARPLGVIGTIIIEASPWVEDNQWLLDLAKDDAFIPAIIGNLNPLEEKYPEHLRRFAKQTKFRGFRINDNHLKKVLEDEKGVQNLQLLSDLGLRLEVNGGPPLLMTVDKTAQKFPKLKIMVNHAANMPNDGKEPQKLWVDGMNLASRNENVYCKISSLTGSARSGGFKGEYVPLDYCRGVMEVLWSSFGSKRLVVGSDWPVGEKGASLKNIFDLPRDFLKTKPPEEQANVFIGNAKDFYLKT